MFYKAFIGIDISKKTIDVAIRLSNLKEIIHETFENNLNGFNKMISWIKKKTGLSGDNLLFCMEHTGIYALSLACYLTEKQIAFRLENPYHIKHSMGIQRGKSDKADAKMIARYAFMHHEEFSLSKFPGHVLLKVQNLLAHRERLIKTKVMYTVAPKELNEFSGSNINQFISQESKDIINLISKKIRAVEKEITELIGQDKDLKRNYELSRSVRGVGFVIASYMLIYTQNYTSIVESRCFASYSGIAPFGQRSGSSISKSPHVSHLANKRMKTLLNNGAWSAVRHDMELKTYFERKTKEGKHELVVINAIRNKLISRVFATVKRGTPYVEINRFCKN